MFAFISALMEALLFSSLAFAGVSSIMRMTALREATISVNCEGVHHCLDAEPQITRHQDPIVALSIVFFEEEIL